MENLSCRWYCFWALLKSWKEAKLLCPNAKDILNISMSLVDILGEYRKLVVLRSKKVTFQSTYVRKPLIQGRTRDRPWINRPKTDKWSYKTHIQMCICLQADWSPLGLSNSFGINIKFTNHIAHVHDVKIDRNICKHTFNIKRKTFSGGRLEKL